MMCLMKGFLNKILRKFGVEMREHTSLIHMHMLDVTHETHLEQLYRQNRIKDYILF